MSGWRCLVCGATGPSARGVDAASAAFHEHYNAEHAPPPERWLDRPLTPRPGSTPSWTGIDDQHIGSGKRRANPHQARHSRDTIRRRNP